MDFHYFRKHQTQSTDFISDLYNKVGWVDAGV